LFLERHRETNPNAIFVYVWMIQIIQAANIVHADQVENVLYPNVVFHVGSITHLVSYSRKHQCLAVEIGIVFVVQIPQQSMKSKDFT
jgi:hypothetical protein